MKRIGIMGGTFDPIHIGHLIAAECARETASLDEVWFMPSYISPQKKHPPVATAIQRLEMVKLALKNHPYFCSCDWEMMQQQVSYTWHTVKKLQIVYPTIEWVWIIGGDRVADLQQWYHIDKLMEQIQFIALCRFGVQWTNEPFPCSWQSRLIFAHMPQLDISSTYIRQRLAERKSVRYMLETEVEQYIARRGLYELHT